MIPLPKIVSLISVLWVGLFVLSSCGQKPQMKKVTWSIRDQAPMPVLGPYSRTDESVKVRGYTVQMGMGRVDGFRIHDTYTKILRRDGGEISYMASQYVEKIPGKILQKAKRLKENKSKLLSKVVSSRPQFGFGESAGDPEIVILPTGRNGWDAVFVYDIVNDRAGQVTRYFVDEQAEIIRFESVQSSLQTGQGAILDLGSRDIKTVIIEKLRGNGKLQGLKLGVTNGAGPSAFSQKHDFRYNVTNPNFDEVQVYHTVQKGFDWFQTQFDYAPPGKLDVKVHLDRANPVNAAFYYNGRIRLGRGDGKIYRDMPKDSSIVLHELAHFYIDKISRLSTRGDSGSINEAFADYFTASILGDPKMGAYSYLKGPYKRNLENKNRAFDDFSGGKYNDSLAVSGTLWEVYQKTGGNTANAYAMSVLARLTPSTSFEDLAVAFKDALSDIPESENRRKIQETLERRNWNP